MKTLHNYFNLPATVALTASLLGMTTLVKPNSSAAASVPSPVESVNPFVGTDAHGHLYPGATVPFGEVQLSPDTRTQGWDACAGYHYDDKIIQGFTHTHLSGTGGADLGDILVMPTVGDIHLDAGVPGDGYVSRFSHERESASPGYYSVFLDDPKVLAELTATERCGLHRYTFPATDNAHFIIDLVHGIGNTPYDCGLNFENNSTISGYKKTHGWANDRSIFFVMQFSRPFTSYGVAQADTRFPDGTKTAQGDQLRAFVTYQTTDTDKTIEIKVGISGTSVEAARKNLDSEAPGFEFDKVRAAAAKQWSDKLDTVQIETPDLHVRRTFYTNLYESYLAPTLFDDVDGPYMGMDHKVHQEAGFHNYTELSIWDIYRAEAPLLNVLQPGVSDDIVKAMLAEYDQNGAHSTPIWPLWGNETWCMIGYHSVPMIVDSYFKGARGFDPEVAYQAMRDTAMQDRSGLDTYKTMGYIPSVRGQQATSKTLEYAYDDWCLARMAQSLGHDDDAKMFYQRASDYRNVFDQTVGFMRGRKADGTWRAPFVDDALVGDEYTEADAWQYAFNVQQDLPGLISIYGGDKPFVDKLDAMFAASSLIHSSDPDLSGLIGQYSQGDEQCHHVAYLYDYAGAAYKTQLHIRQVMAELYNDTPSGQCGNDDCGQMSAWYIFSALGFYPVNPTSGIYMIGSPAVSKATLHLDSKNYGGHAFTVIAANNSDSNVYIQSATLNGKPLNRAYITQSELAAGGTLRFDMGPSPNKDWASAESTRPAPTMPADFQYAALPTPSIPQSDQPTVFPLPIRIACGSDDPIGNFLPDPDMIDGDTHGASPNIDLNVPNAAPAGVYQIERYASDMTYTFPVPKNGAYTVRLHFAEIFDSSAGQRIENIAINGNPKLTNFDIYAAGGGENKAIVKEFDNIAPDAAGNISIHITATPNSPDQNAKINGIEILSDTIASGKLVSDNVQKSGA